MVFRFIENSHNWWLNSDSACTRDIDSGSKCLMLMRVVGADISYVCIVLLDKKLLFIAIRRTARSTKPFDILLKLNFSAGCKCSYTNLKIPVDFEVRIQLFHGSSFVNVVIFFFQLLAIRSEIQLIFLLVLEMARYS